MSKLAVKKKFDCIDMKRKAQERIYRDTKDMTPKQEMEYIHKMAREGSAGKIWRKFEGTSVLSK